MKERAEKKCQIAIDKMIDLMSMVDSSIIYKIETALEIIREVEYEVTNGKVQGGIIIHQ